MRSRLFLIALLVLTVSASFAQAQFQYWDLDIVSQAGAGGTAPTGVWNSFSNYWNVNSTGLGIPTTWTPGNSAVFAAGSTATGAYTVSVSGTQSLAGLFVEEGVVSQNGGILAFGATDGAPINIASGSAWGQNVGSSFTGTGGIVKSGSGTLYLRGNNPFTKSGAGSQPFLTINNGVVDFVADTNLGAAPSATDNSAALLINGGTLRYTNISSLALAPNRGVTVGSGGATFEVVNGVTLALSSVANANNALTGSGTITKTGVGRFRLQTAQTTFTGKYIVKGGSLAFPSQNQLGAIPATTQADYFTLDGGGLFGDLSTGMTLDAKRGITIGAGGGYLAFVGTGLTAYDGIISGTLGGGLSLTANDAFSANASGMVSLNSANTYNGPTLISTGMVASVAILANGGSNSGIGSSSNAAANLIIDGGALQYRGNATFTDRNFTITSTGTIDASGANNAPLVFTNTAPVGLSGAGLHILYLRGTSTGDNTLSQAILDQSAGSSTTLNKLDTGTWVIKNIANSYTGNTIVGGGGWLKLGASGVIPDTSVVQLGGSSTFTLNGFDETIKSLSGTTGIVALGSKTLTINNPNGEAFWGWITGTGGGRIVKNGTGKFALNTSLSPSGTYDGGLTLNAGKLGIGTNVALGTGTLVVNNSPTLAASLSTAVVPTNSVTLNGNLTFDDSFTTTPGLITWNPSGTNHWTITGDSRTITVNTAAGGYVVTINQSIDQDAPLRGVTKAGNGLLALNGINYYTGDTTVAAGTLSLAYASLADSANVRLSTGSILNLKFASGTPDLISALFIDGVEQSTGTWGAIGSGAMHETSLITGPGLLSIEEGIINLPLPGDFNNDGIVDAGDYATWRKANGTNNALLNDAGLGTPVRLAHLDLWRQNFGRVLGPGSGGIGLHSGTIPEPASVLLLSFGIAALSVFTARRARLGT